MPLNPTDFHRMWIVVPTNLQQHLAAGNLLVCSHEQVQFVLTYGDADKAQARRAELEQTDPRPAYVVQVDADGILALGRADRFYADPVDGQGRSPGRLKLSGTTEENDQDVLRTEHGPRYVSSVLLTELRHGDFFAVTERTEPYRDWVVYRALEDGVDGTVRGERTGWGGAPRAGQRSLRRYRPGRLPDQRPHGDARRPRVGGCARRDLIHCGDPHGPRELTSLSGAVVVRCRNETEQRRVQKEESVVELLRFRPEIPLSPGETFS